MNIELIEDFLINECGYKSIEDAIANTPRINLYAFVGEVKDTDTNSTELNLRR